MGKGGFRNESFKKNDKRGEGARHGKFDDEKKSSPGVSGERYRVEKRDVGNDSPPLKQGSLNEDTVDFLAGVADLSEWTPGLEESLVREGFVKDSKDVDGNRRVYAYPVPAGGLKDFAFTPEEALKILRGAVGDEDIIAKSATPTISGVEGEGRISNTTVEQNVPEGKKVESAPYIEESQESLVKVLVTIPGGKHLVVDTVAKGVSEVRASAVEAMASPEGAQKAEGTDTLTEIFNKGVNVAKREDSVIDVASIPLGLAPLTRKSINYIHTMMSGNKPPITSELLNILRLAGYSVSLIRVESGGKRVPRKARVFLQGDKTRAWELTQKEIIELLKRKIEAQKKEFVAVKEENEIPIINDVLTDVDESGAINPYFVNKDLEKNDQGVDANKLDINDFRKIQYKQEEGRQAIADLFAQKGGLVKVSSGGNESEFSVDDEFLRFRKKDVPTTQEEPASIVGSLNKNTEIPEDFENIDGVWQRKATGVGEDMQMIRVHEISPELLSDFDKEFQLTQENLKGMERLSTGQQKLVLENLREHRRENKTGPVGRVWNYILNKKTGEGTYAGMARTLIEGAVQFGPKVHETKEGQLLVDVTGVELGHDGSRKENKQIVDRFNAIAHEYAKMKAGDIAEHSGRGRESESRIASFFKNVFSESRNKHDTLTSAYEEAKERLSGVLVERLGEAQAVAKLIEIEGKVQSLRFIQTEAEASAVVKENPDQNLWQKVAGQVLSKENVLYFGLGLASRTVLKEAIGIFAGPAVAGALGGIRSWNRTSRELKEGDERGRHGIKSQKPRIGELKTLMSEIIMQQNEMKLTDAERETNPDYLELRRKLGSFNDELMKITSEDLNIVDASRRIKFASGEKDQGVTQKLQDLIDQYRDTADEQKREDLLAKINARTGYVEGKLSENKINFGSGDERMQNMANLSDTLTNAKLLLTEADKDVASKLQDVVSEYHGSLYESGKPQEREELLKKMSALVQYTEWRTEHNLINFGSGDKRVQNMARFFEMFGNAKILLTDAEMPKGSGVGDRLEQYLTRRDGVIQTRRRNKHIKVATWNILKAGAISLAGIGAMEYAEREFGTVTKIRELFGGNTKVIPPAETSGSQTVPSVKEAPTLDIETAPRVETPPLESIPPKEVRAPRPAVPERSGGGGDIQKDSTPATRPEGVKVDAREVSSEPAPKPVSGSAPSSGDQVPRPQTSGELQRVSVENGDEGRLYSDEIKTSESTAPTQEGVGEGAKIYEEAEPIQNPIYNAKDPELNTGTGTEAHAPEANTNVSDAGASEAPEASSATGDTGVDKETRVGGESPAPGPNQPAGGSIPEPEQPSPKAIEIEDRPVETTYENEALRTPENPVGVETNATEAAPSVYDYENDGGTPLDTESGAPEAKTTPDTVSTQEVFKNANGVEIDPKKEHIYELSGRDGEKVMVSYGGKNFETRFDTAQEYVQKNPDAVVVVEEEPRYGVFGQKLPPSYVEVRNVRGEGVTTFFSIQDNTLPTSSEKGIDPGTFTKKVTK